MNSKAYQRGNIAEPVAFAFVLFVIGIIISSFGAESHLKDDVQEAINKIEPIKQAIGKNILERKRPEEVNLAEIPAIHLTIGVKGDISLTMTELSKRLAGLNIRLIPTVQNNKVEWHCKATSPHNLYPLRFLPKYCFSNEAVESPGFLVRVGILLVSALVAVILVFAFIFFSDSFLFHSISASISIAISYLCWQSSTYLGTAYAVIAALFGFISVVAMIDSAIDYFKQRGNDV